MGIWIDIRTKGKRKHPWHFAYYIESPSQRDDGQSYQAFLFRDEERSRFGRKEFLGRTISRVNFGKMAARVVADVTFRKALLSDDPSLPKLWKRH